MVKQRRYPIGIQTFSRVIREGYIYVDKTDLVWQLAHYATYVFLSRPRRFGKSLLTSTLESYFLGEKELFEGLKIMSLEKEWEKYPVLHLDLSGTKHMPPLQSGRSWNSCLGHTKLYMAATQKKRLQACVCLAS